MPPLAEKGSQPPTRLVVAVLGTSTIGLVSLYSMPLLVGALIEHLGLDARTAGFVAATEVGSMALTIALLAQIVARYSRVRVAAAGAVLVVVGQSASGFVTVLPALFVCRALTGIGAGAALAASSASLSATDEPERLYARVTVLRSLGLGILLPILPFIIARWGHAGAYVPMAALALVSVPAIAWLPAPVTSTMSPTAGSAVNAGWAVALLAAIIFVASGDGAIWAFSERIGVSTGLSSHTVGLALAGSTLMGLLGASAADYFGTSLGRTRPLVAAVAVVVASSFVLTHSSAGRGFLSALVVYATAFFFLVPYLMGSAAALDSTGRWSAAASAMFLAGQAIGPAIGGIIMTSPAGGEGLSWLALCLGTVALLLAVPVTKYLDRQCRVDCSGAGLGTRLGTQPQA